MPAARGYLQPHDRGALGVAEGARLPHSMETIMLQPCPARESIHDRQLSPRRWQKLKQDVRRRAHAARVQALRDLSGRIGLAVEGRSVSRGRWPWPASRPCGVGSAPTPSGAHTGTRSGSWARSTTTCSRTWASTDPRSNRWCTASITIERPSDGGRRHGLTKPMTGRPNAQPAAARARSNGSTRTPREGRAIERCPRATAINRSVDAARSR